MAVTGPEAPGVHQIHSLLRVNGLKRRCDSITSDDGSSTALPAKKSKPLSFSNPRQVVYIIVGPDECTQTFPVYKNVLCQHSPVFAATLSGVVHILTLEDVCPNTFRMLLHWFSKHQVELSPINGAPNDLLSLAKIWALATDCAIPEVQNQVLLQIHWLLGQPISNSMDLMGFIKYVEYVGAGNETPLTGIAVEMVAHGIRKNAFASSMDVGDFPKRFQGDVAGNLREFENRLYI